MPIFPPLVRPSLRLVVGNVFVGVEVGDGAKLEDEIYEILRVVRGFEVSLVGDDDDSEYS